MDHLPIAGREGSLEQLAMLPCRHRVYTHINNTNPVLLERSPERAAVTQAGLTVGYDGLHFVVGARGETRTTVVSAFRSSFSRLLK
jgi:pyrroloquinoline quinone biosynthesis protein B